ncbi:MAG: prepilin-type N-terminal cleavage/methylation domain-containing protein [Pseudomonadota bacterium]
MVARRSSGFTLIEVLVVLAIAATLTALVVLRLGDLRSPDDPERLLERLAARVTHQCEQALFQARPRGLRFSEFGYVAWQSSAEGWRVLPQTGPDRAQMLPESLDIELVVSGYSVDLAEVEFDVEDLYDTGVRDVRPQVICHPLGELTPFQLTLAQNRDRWTLTAEANGRLTIERPDA